MASQKKAIQIWLPKNHIILEQKNRGGNSYPPYFLRLKNDMIFGSHEVVSWKFIFSFGEKWARLHDKKEIKKELKKCKGMQIHNHADEGFSPSEPVSQ